MSDRLGKKGKFRPRIRSPQSLIPLMIFFILGIALTFKLLTLPDIVIGDNYLWTVNSVVDSFGTQFVHLSYMGNFEIASVFDTGFIYPVSYAFAAFKVPFTILYPFLFYVLCMFSFYSFSGEFLNKRSFRTLASLMYTVNPVIPYFYQSIPFAFALIFPPLALKYALRALRALQNQTNAKYYDKDLTLSAVFVSLTISAEAQISLSIAIVTVFLLGCFLAVWIKRYGLGRSLIQLASNITLFILTFLIILFPLLLSTVFLKGFPDESYYSGRFTDFISTVGYTYSTANPLTILRLGGDSGTGLGQNSWYDSSSISNIFGYVYFGGYLASVGIMIKQRMKFQFTERIFFYSMALLFLLSFLLIELVKSIFSHDTSLAFNAFNISGSLLETWETPIKLQFIMVLSCMTTMLILFKKAETLKVHSNHKITLSVVLILILVSSLVAYNSPWIISSAGDGPLQQVATVSGATGAAGQLYYSSYAGLSQLVDANFSNVRGIVIPYYHETELYMPPNFRLFQSVSLVNQKVSYLTQSSEVDWSKVLGLLSIKSVIIDPSYLKEQNPNTGLIFPEIFGNNLTQAIQQMESSPGLSLYKETNGYTIYQNQYALPLTYASDYYVLYNSNDILKYALEVANFSELPVFLMSGNAQSLQVPSSIGPHRYEIYMLTDGMNSSATQDLNLSNGSSNTDLKLSYTGTLFGSKIFSGSSVLSEGQSLSYPGQTNWSSPLKINNMFLNSSASDVGQYSNFMLNFTSTVVQQGIYNYLSPRLYLNQGNITYGIIFHTNGVVELVSWKGPNSSNQQGTFISDIESSNVGYDLNGPAQSIRVSVVKDFDGVSVYVDGSQALSFPINPSATNVTLASTQSVSEFSDVSLRTKNSVGIMAVRLDPTELTVSNVQSGPQSSSLSVGNASGDFAIISQFLGSSLRNIVGYSVREIIVNSIFSGWIVNSTSNSKDVRLTMDVQGTSQFYLTLIISILFTYVILFIGIVGLVPPRKVTLRLSR